MRRFILAVIIYLLISTAVRAQKVLTGSIQDSTGNGLGFATIGIVDQMLLLKSYTLTDQKGKFQIPIEDSLFKKDLFLQVTCLGYKKSSLKIRNGVYEYKVILHQEERNLAPVIIKGERVKLKIRGDTLTYDVRAFSNSNDRVIEDVLKKMPGIDIDDKGKITYNGKAITNFYLDGDNLLDDRYVSGTRNIPNKLVDKVQIFDNHQPIKALMGKAITDQVDINITFRDSAKLKPISQAKIGAGLPGNYDEMLNTLLFHGNYKSINYFKTNNIGTDLTEELTSTNLSDILKRLDISPPRELLSAGTVTNPDLASYRYLFNNTGLFNFNNLIKLKPDVNLKANISYLYDFQRQISNTQSQIYIPGDTVNYTEKIRNEIRPHLLHASLNLNANKTKYYLDDIFTTDINYSKLVGDLQANGSTYNQRLNNNLYNFSNQLNYISSAKNRTYEVYSFINYISNPGSLQIEPGINPGIFNNGNAFASLNQYVRVPSFFTNNFLTFRFSSLKIQQAYKIGLNTTNQNLFSDFSKILLNGIKEPAIDSGKNNLVWNRAKVFSEANYSYKSDRVTLMITLPLSYQAISYRDADYIFSKKVNNFIFNPFASFKYMVGAENYLNLHYRFNTDFGNIEDVYRGYILRNYRSLYANDAPLYQINTNSLGGSFNYREALKLLFITVGAIYDIKQNNSIAMNFFTNSFEQRVLVPANNTTKNLQLNSSFSKYLFDYKTTVNLKIGWQVGQYNQILNQSLIRYNNYTTTATFSIDSKITDRLFVKYNSLFMHFESAPSSGSLTSIIGETANQFRQKAEINLGTLSNLNLKFAGEQYYSEQILQKTTNYIFVDATLQYRFIKYKIDIEAGFLNLGNVTTFTSMSISSNIITATNYQLRGRIAIAKLIFNF